MPRLFLTAALILGALLPLRAEDLIPQGQQQSIIATANLRVVVPKHLRHELIPIAQRAELIFVQMAADAQYPITEPLWVLLSDREDRHNGFSTVVPRPLVQAELVAANPTTSIAAYDQTLVTLIHEFAHHITNDRDQGFRKVLRRIFGRVMPGDLLSLVVFYFSTPAHQTMPDFWHEGLAMWAESTYSLDPDLGPDGRAHDPLQWARWRLAVAAGSIPDVGEWRYITHRYPYGRNAYDWGLMYMRYLIAQGHNPWEMAREQASRWAFSFNRGVRRSTGATHAQLINRALQALDREMQAQLEALRAAGASEPTALQESDALFAMPAWLDNERLLTMHASAYRRPRLAELHVGDGNLERNGPGVGFTPLRIIQGLRDDGPWVLVQTTRSRSLRNQLETWIGRRGRVLALYDSELNKHYISGHFLEGDGRWIDDSWLHLAAIERQAGGKQALVIGRVDSSQRGTLALQDMLVVPHQGRPWFPAWRPQHHELVWVEQEADQYRLVLGNPLVDDSRQTLWTGDFRILNPQWSADGRYLYVASDRSGVANAYVFDLQAEAPVAQAVTNVLGTVMAAVPSPDGQQLALLVERSEGFNIAVVDAASRVEQLPQIASPWQAPDEDSPLQRRALAIDQALRVPVSVDNYRGLFALRPLYWTPTTMPVPEGGYGAAGIIADPLMTHVVRAGAGVGLDNGPVGRLEYSWSGWHLTLGGAAWQTEEVYEDVLLNGQEFERSDTIRGGELRVGRGFAMGNRGDFLYLAGGFERIEGDYEEPANPGPGINRRQPRVDEHYLEIRGGRSLGGFRLPDGFGSGSGLSVAGSYRHSGLGGDVEGDSASGLLRFSMDVIPEYGQQLVLLTAIGWSDGDQSLRRSFTVGGDSAFLPRGYNDVMARGRYFNAGSIAWRTPLWRPFTSWGPSALVHRQIILEAFADAATVNNSGFLKDIDDSNSWYTSAGLSLHSSWLVWRAMLNPGVGAAYRFEDDEVRAWFTIDFPW